MKLSFLGCLQGQPESFCTERKRANGLNIGWPLFWGLLNLTKMKKLPGRFYRWTTDGSFSGGFQKNVGIFGTSAHGQIFFTIFYSYRVRAAGSGLVQGP